MEPKFLCFRRNGHVLSFRFPLGKGSERINKQVPLIERPCDPLLRSFPFNGRNIRLCARRSLIQRRQVPSGQNERPSSASNQLAGLIYMFTRAT